MTRKEAIVAGMAGLSALAMGAQSLQAESSTKANPEVEKIRALLKAHDKAMTNHDLAGVMKCLTGKAAIMGTGPGEIWVGPAEIKVAFPLNVSLTVTKQSGAWKIAAMHFSTLTGPDERRAS